MIVEEDLDLARYELKFNAHTSQYQPMLNWIDLHSGMFSKAYDQRIVNNIYFDSEDLDSYTENLTGISSRTKLRLRWYGDTFDPREASLELKIKRNRLGWKVQDRISFDDQRLTQMDWTEIQQFVGTRVSDYLRLHWSMNPYPVILNRYERDYFLSSDGKTRITVDKNVRFFDQRTGSHLNTAFENICPDMLILEVKFDARDLAAGEKALSEIRLQRTKSSKFVIGVTSILGY